MISLWMNDTERDLEKRVKHFLSKTYEALRFVWVVGDSTDGTYEKLRELTNDDADRVTIVEMETNIKGMDPNSRLKRLSQTASTGFDFVIQDDDFVIVHESDLISPANIVQRFLKRRKCPIGGMVWLGVKPGCFYDIWGYRDLAGNKFRAAYPFTEDYHPTRPFEVSSIGSVYMLHAGDLLEGGIRLDSCGVVELCDKLRQVDRRIWVDPKINIFQPKDLFIHHDAPPDC